MKEYWPVCFRRLIKPISRGIRTDQFNFFIPAEKKLLIFYAGSSYRQKEAFAAKGRLLITANVFALWVIPAEN